jgi:hypothetical protein
MRANEEKSQKPTCHSVRKPINQLFGQPANQSNQQINPLESQPINQLEDNL